MPAAPSEPPAPQPALPQPLPLFPLSTVLFPQAVLPLQIFEVRYLDMIARAQREGSVFGVVALLEGHEVRRAGAAVAERLAEVGTLARITHLERPGPGLMRVRCEGTRRFRLLEREQLPHGLWVGRVELLPEDPELPVPEDLSRPVRLMQDLLEDLQSRADAPLEALCTLPAQPGRCAWLANTWASLLPLPLPVKQRLLELDSPLLRLELIDDALDQVQPRLS